MIIEYTYSTKDLKKRCYQCMYLQMQDEWFGRCICETNKIKIRNREITDKACVHRKVERND